MRELIVILLLSFASALRGQGTAIDATRLVKPAASANRLFVTNNSGATAWLDAASFFTNGPGIGISGNTISNTGDTDGSNDVLIDGNTVTGNMAIGTNSAHSLILETGGNAVATFSTGYVVTLSADVSSTNTALDQLVIGRNTTGTPGNGLGTAIAFLGETSTTQNQPMGGINMTWTTVTNSTRTSRLAFSTVNSASGPTDRMYLSGAGELGIGATPISGLEFFTSGEGAFGANVANTTRAGRALNLIDGNAVMRVWRYTSTATAGPSVELVWGNTGDDVNNSSNRFWDFYLSGQSNAFGIRQRTGGVNNTAIFINSTRKVSIGNGENQPTAHLQVKGDGTASTDTVFAAYPSTGTGILYAFGNGRVGINTAGPGEALDVNGQARVDALDIRAWTGSSNTTAGQVQYHEPSSISGYLTYGNGERRFPVLASNIQLQCVDYNTNWTTGRTRAFFTVPSWMNGWKVSKAYIAVSTIGSTTGNTVVIEKGGSSQGSQTMTAATHSLTMDFDIATDDILTVNITGVGATPSKGLFVMLELRYQ